MSALSEQTLVDFLEHVLEKEKEHDTRVFFALPYERLPNNVVSRRIACGTKGEYQFKLHSRHEGAYRCHQARAGRSVW